MALDYLTKGLPAGINNYLDEDFIVCDNNEATCRKIYHSMDEYWREEYWNDSEKYGRFIETCSQRLLSDKLKALQGNHHPSPHLENIWRPPVAVPIDAIKLVSSCEQEQPEPIISNLYGKGEGFVIAGAAGIGKSLLNNYLAHVLATQKSLWGMFDIPRPITSLIIQSEVSGYAQRTRLNKLLSAYPRLKTDKVHYLSSFFNPDDCRITRKLDDPQFQAIVTSAIKEVGAEVAFLDPFISFNPADENNNTAIRAILDEFERIVNEAGASLCVTHHPGKSGHGLRGASAIRDWAANVIELQLDRLEGGEARIKFVHNKARNFEQVDSFYLTRTKDLAFEIGEDKATHQEDMRLRCVIDALKQAGGAITGQKQFTAAVGKLDNGVQERAAISRIKDARDLGLIIETDSGYRNQKIYSLPKG